MIDEGTSKNVQFEDPYNDSRQIPGIMTHDIRGELMRQSRTPLLIRIVLRLRLARSQAQARKVLLCLAVLLLIIMLFCLKKAFTSPTVSFLKLK